MLAAFDAVFATGVQRVAIIGTDLPWISQAVIGEALDRVENDRLVVGPAQDGGYYLLALAAAAPREGLFKGIEWSTPTVLADTEKRARLAGLEIVRLAEQRDIDTIEDVRTEGSTLAPLLAPDLRRRVTRLLQVP